MEATSATAEGVERVVLGNGGWVLFETSADLPPVWVRFAEAAGRLRLVEIYVAQDAGLDTHTLRRFPLGRVEAWVNDPQVAEAIMSRVDLPGPDLRRAAAHFNTSFGTRASHWVADMFRAQVRGSGVGQAPMPKHRPKPSAEGMLDQVLDLRLDIPSTRDYGDDFYRQVAKVYAELARFRGRSPGPEIAKANGTPVSTVHRWVKEARRRGFLPPGHAGKAG